VVADGEGIQTWSEVGLGDLSTVRIDTDRSVAPDVLQLPLVVGAVQASSVLLDAREQARVHSPQLEQHQQHERATSDSDEPTEPTELTEPTQPTEPLGSEVEPTELLPGPPPAGPTVEATVCPHGHPNPPGTTRCRECGDPIQDLRPRTVAQPVLALLRASDGAEAAVDRTVLVGRAPAQSVGAGARLLTVPSPEQDISRTHLQVTPDGWRVLVTDLHSTNGTLLLPPGSSERRLLTPGEPVAVELGSMLELADGVSVLVDVAR
jgi:hypothetical protein